MALQLFKLASEAFPTISATTSQVAHAYYRTMSATVPITAGGDFSLEVSTWVKETGNAATRFATGQGLSLLSINGVLQQPGLYSITSGAVVITGPAGGISLTSSYPITLQTFNVDTAITMAPLALSTRIAIP